jgi:hypothetical protein
MIDTTPVNGREQREAGLLSRHPQSVAWFVLVGSFTVFLIICGVSTFLAYWFLFESQVDLKVQLQVSRGSVQVSYVDGAEDRLIGTALDIDGAAVIRVNESSQGHLTFVDNYSRQVIATVYLLPDTAITVRRGQRPRFEWSRNDYRLLINDAMGDLRVEIPAALARGVDLSVGSAFGDAIFTQGGDYLLDVNGDRMALHAYSGSGLLRNVVNQTWQVPEQQVGVLGRSTQAVNIAPFPYLVLNRGFGEKTTVSTDATLPIGWGCTMTTDADTTNQWRRGLTLDDRVALFMSRTLGGATVKSLIDTHGETGCEYPLLQEVSQYTSLRIRARLMIRDQSLSSCGDVGTECPVMLQMDFTRASLGADGKPIRDVWRHGFYAQRPDNDWRPLICDTCPQLHERIIPNVWYFYDSGDLFGLLPRERRPARLDVLKVYASGHAYDVVIGDIQVIVGTMSAAPN